MVYMCVGEVNAIPQNLFLVQWPTSFFFSARPIYIYISMGYTIYRYNAYTHNVFERKRKLFGNWYRSVVDYIRCMPHLLTNSFSLGIRIIAILCLMYIRSIHPKWRSSVRRGLILIEFLSQFKLNCIIYTNLGFICVCLLEKDNNIRSRSEFYFLSCFS